MKLQFSCPYQLAMWLQSDNLSLSLTCRQGHLHGRWPISTEMTLFLSGLADLP